MARQSEVKDDLPPVPGLQNVQKPVVQILCPGNDIFGPFHDLYVYAPPGLAADKQPCPKLDDRKGETIWDIKRNPRHQTPNRLSTKSSRDPQISAGR